MGSLLCSRKKKKKNKIVADLVLLLLSSPFSFAFDKRNFIERAIIYEECRLRNVEILSKVKLN